MSEENISIFRQELERVKTQFEDKFQDIMASVRADRENDKRTLQMVNENLNNDRKAIDQNRALNDKLETLLNVQNTMLSELRSMNNSMKDLSGGGGGMGLGGLLAGAAAGGLAGFFLNGDGDNNVDGGGGNDVLRTTRGGETRDTSGGTRTTSGTSDQRDTALMVYDSFINAGFSPDQARALTAEVFRENAFGKRHLFGTHSDPANQANNIGMFSWQGPRNDELLQFMRDYENENNVNLFGSNGEMLQTQESLNVQALFARGEMVSNSHGGSQTQNERIQAWLSNPNPSDAESIQAVGGDFIRWALNNSRYRQSGLENRQVGLDILDEALERRNNTDDTPAAERVSGNDGVTELLNRFNIDPNSLRFDEEGRLKNELYDTEGYPIRLSPKDAEELSQGLGLELPSSMEELRSDLASRDVAVEYEERFWPGRPDRDNTEELITKSNETIRKYYAERLGLPEDISMKEIREYMLENDISSAPALKSTIIGKGGEEDIAGMFRDLEDVESRVQEASGHHRTGSGPAEHRDYSQGLLAARMRGDSPLTEYLAERATAEDISGGGDDDLSGGIGNDTLEPQSPVGPRIPETSPEQDPFDPFSLVSPMRLSGDLTTIGLNENPELRAALEEQAAAETEETPRETTSGGYTGGGGGSSEQEQPQIEANAIGRFPWAEKLIKYYNLSNMIKTNMLS